MEGSSRLTAVFLSAKLYLSEECSGVFFCVFWETKVTGIPPLQIRIWGNTYEKELDVLFIFTVPVPDRSPKSQQGGRPSAAPAAVFGRFCCLCRAAVRCRALYAALWLMLPVRRLHISGVIKTDLNYGKIFRDCKK